MSQAVMFERFPAGCFTPQNRETFSGVSPQYAPGNRMVMMPRCTMRFEKCDGGFKIHCCCEDQADCATLQELCNLSSDGLCSCCCTKNGIPCCQVFLCWGTVKCELTKDGCCITCTSGDKGCCDMLQACCDCLDRCLHQGCCCYVAFGGTTICCGK